MRLRVAGLALAAVAGGCATLVPPNEASLNPLLRALTEPVAKLRDRTEASDAQARLAYAILAENRLRGVRETPAMAETLKLSATAQSRSQPMSIYVPGVNGRPGTVLNTTTRVYDIPPAHAAAVADCTAALRTDARTAEAERACGGAALHARLRGLWAQAKIDLRTTPEALAALKCEPVSVAPVLAAASEAFGDRDLDRASVLSDRVIAVCGEAEGSWLARVLRGLVAVNKREGLEAVRLMRPVPKPGPQPIGALSSWIDLRGRALAGDRGGFTRERDALMEAAAGALGRRGREIGRFTAAGNRVAAFEVGAPASGATPPRRIYLITPGDPQADPRAIHMTLAGAPGALRWSLNEYRCDGGAVLRGGELNAPAPAEPEIRRLVVERLEGRLQARTDTAAAGEFTPCVHLGFITPGLGD